MMEKINTRMYSKAGVMEREKADFIAKMGIASKEARETKYWIDLLIKTDCLDINENYAQSLVADTEEIIKLLTSIVKVVKEIDE